MEAGNLASGASEFACSCSHALSSFIGESLGKQGENTGRAPQACSEVHLVLDSFKSPCLFFILM